MLNPEKSGGGKDFRRPEHNRKDGIKSRVLDSPNASCFRAAGSRAMCGDSFGPNARGQLRQETTDTATGLRPD
jgi:hypothetical protein